MFLLSRISSYITLLTGLQIWEACKVLYYLTLLKKKSITLLRSIYSQCVSLFNLDQGSLHKNTCVLARLYDLKNIFMVLSVALLNFWTQTKAWRHPISVENAHRNLHSSDALISREMRDPGWSCRDREIKKKETFCIQWFISFWLFCVCQGLAFLHVLDILGAVAYLWYI